MSDDSTKMVGGKAVTNQYKGLVCIKCEKCGKIHMFFAQNELQFYYCLRCKSKIILDLPPVKLFVRHECGNRKKYVTNIRDRLIDVQCYQCGAPVTVEWQHKKRLYETVKE